jgi:hypothetical protein
MKCPAWPDREHAYGSANPINKIDENGVEWISGVECAYCHDRMWTKGSLIEAFRNNGLL